MRPIHLHLTAALVLQNLVPGGAVPDASMMDTMFFVPAGPADEMEALTLQDLLGDTKGADPQAPGAAPPAPPPPAAPPAPGGAWSAVKKLASAAAGEAAHLAHEASHMAQEAVRSAAQAAAAAKQEERRWADEIAAKRRANAVKKGGRGSRQEYRVEVEAPESECSIYNFTKCNGFERGFINSAHRSLKKITDDIVFWESEIARGVTSTPKGQMRYATMVHILKELKKLGEDEGEDALKLRWKSNKFEL